MDIHELRSSGILELYVLGLASEEEVQWVESALEKDPSLTTELQEIASALENYAYVSATEPSPGLRDRILSDIRSMPPQSKKDRPGSSSGSWLGPLGWLLVMLLTALVLYQTNEKEKYRGELEAHRLLCDSLENVYKSEMALFDQLRDPATRIVVVQPTEAYPETDLVFYNNPEKGTNVIHLRSLPSLGPDQAFQLWALRDGSDPIPLDVFSGQSDFAQVGYEASVQAYAITIEPSSGSRVPTLENLIGVFAL